MTNKNFLVTYYQTLMEVFDPWGSKNLKIDYKCQKIEKNGDVKILQDFPLHLEIKQTYFQTLDEVPWLLRLRKF